MSTNRNIVEMVEAIRKGTGGSNSADGVDGDCCGMFCKRGTSHPDGNLAWKLEGV